MTTERTASAQGPAATRPALRDLLFIAVGVLGVSTSGPIIAAAAAVPALAIAFWRNALSLVVLAPAALARRGELRQLRPRTWGLCLGAGALLAAHFGLWVPSLSFTSVASSTAIVCMQAVWTAVFARLVGHEIARRVWLGMALALVGVVLVTGVDVTLESRALVGDLLALAGGVFSGAYVVVGSQVRQSVSTTTYTSLCYGTCALLLLVTCLIGGVSLAGWGLHEWALLVALMLAAQLLGHSLFNAVLQRVSPTLVSLSILLEVPGAALLAAVWLGQVPPTGAIPGMALILLGIAIVITGRPGETSAVPVE